MSSREMTVTGSAPSPSMRLMLEPVTSIFSIFCVCWANAPCDSDAARQADGGELHDQLPLLEHFAVPVRVGVGFLLRKRCTVVAPASAAGYRGRTRGCLANRIR
jgi:hypothetical protein